VFKPRQSLSAFLRSRLTGYVASAAAVLAVALILWPVYPEVRSVTAATALMIIVLLSAIIWGMGPALVASVLGAVCLNFFYVPPTLKFELRIAAGDDLIALVAFLVASILVGQLSSRAQRRAREVQELYDKLRSAFDRASQMEAIRQSERLKSALLDTVTHDLRTPLTSIKAAATALIDVWKSGASTPALARASEENLVRIIVQQSDRLNHFIEGMIELAKIEAGEERGTHDSEASQIEDIIAAALARAADALREHVVAVDCEENLTTAAKPKAVAQVLFSLLENAGKYALPGTAVRLLATRHQNDGVQIAVEDEGPGVPAELREKVFEKFFRSQVTDRRPNRVEGLGLGLAIARGIVEAYGGRIWAEERGAGITGARFVFTLPSANRVETAEMEKMEAR
jgi:K+-sensing histidine kinase KdpD